MKIGVYIFATDYTIAMDELITDLLLGTEVTADQPVEVALLHRGVETQLSAIRGALFLGGEGGNGILLARQKDGSWSYPAFYSLASISFGLQVGGQSAI